MRVRKHSAETKSEAIVPHIGLYASIFVFWLLLDFITKRIISSGGYPVGSQIAGPFLGLIDFRLVHNTGAAWGIFSDSTFALAMISLFVCVAILFFAMTTLRDSPRLVHIGLALVIAGGIGNAIDRLWYGYVIDFIEPIFIDFPVFNIADIGVTCGFTLFIIGLLIEVPKGKNANAAVAGERQ